MLTAFYQLVLVHARAAVLSRGGIETWSYSCWSFTLVQFLNFYCKGDGLHRVNV